MPTLRRMIEAWHAARDHECGRAADLHHRVEADDLNPRIAKLAIDDAHERAREYERRALITEAISNGRRVVRYQGSKRAA